MSEQTLTITSAEVPVERDHAAVETLRAGPYPHTAASWLRRSGVQPTRIQLTVEAAAP